MAEKTVLLYGTGNAAKFSMMQTYLKDIEEIELIGLKDLDCAWEEPQESGNQPLENARQKALCYYRTCHRPVFSADSGLFIEGLPDGEQPGVHVRRVGGRNLTDEEMRAHYKEIAARFGGKCVAQYQNAVCLVFSEDEIYESQAKYLWEPFYLTTQEREQRREGFPLDAISADIRTGRHCYDAEQEFGLESSKTGFSRFFREALTAHEKRKGTRRLYYEDAYQKDFEAVVVRCEKTEGNYSVVLDCTAFYPEGGGQPCDKGILQTLQDGQTVSVLDVWEKDREVWHLCDGKLKTGARVRGNIDWERRIGHMREHSGEHILSGIICQTHGYRNIGFHMGKDFVTVDFSGMLTQEQIDAAERAANEKVLENVEIAAAYPDAGTLKKLDYRSKKELDGAVRIVTVPGADCCACCGTHVRRTGEVGPIKVIGSEHYKEGIRLHVLIGKKALADYAEKSVNCGKISALLSVKPEHAAKGVEKLLESMNTLRLEYGALKMQLLEQKVEAVCAGERTAVLFEKGLSSADVRRLADGLHRKAGFAAVFCGDDREGYQYVMISAERDMAGFGKAFNHALQGRGGGRNPMIQGFTVASRASIEAYLASEFGL